MALWSDFESLTLNQQYQLGRLARSEGRLAWFHGSSATGEAVTISITETLNDEGELLQRLRALTEVSSPQLMAIREVNPIVLLDTHMVYAVMEPAGESLGDILRDRVLDAGEAREVLESVLRGVAALHARGFVHGRVEADSIVAVGQEIKLRTDCAHRLTAGAPFENAAAQDVRQIGELLARSLSKRAVTGENDPGIQLLPAPFATVVRRALTGHGTIAELASLAGMPSPMAAQFGASKPAATPAPVPAAAKETPAAPAQKQASEQKPAAVASAVAAAPSARSAAAPPPAPSGTAAGEKPGTAAKAAAAGVATDSISSRAKASRTAQQPLAFEEDEEETGSGALRRKSAPYFIGAAAVLVLLVILLFHGLAGRHKAATENSAPAPAPVASASQSAATGAPSTQAAAPAPAAPAPAEASSPAAAPEVVPGWRVIAYTYNHRGQAEHKVDSIEKKHPQLHPTVFAPKGDRAPFLVELGGVMSREQADRLRELAWHMGMPRDTFIRNYR